MNKEISENKKRKSDKTTDGSSDHSVKKASYEVSYLKKYIRID